ncbi:hypothetical protein MKW98_000186 [Papaver atlanticum]|uniref:Uncharacterized protein n=1 Tax=Papaver atlanticum TaxID=357466 RepID=A0AAD4SS61_9MAGN|nr:hypothetical protein MKW98_000186 [Papaver atlanticum]
MQYMKKEDQSVYRSSKTDQSLTKVFSTVSASPLLPDLPCNDSFGLSFARRESAPPIRSLFPAHFYHDVEVMAKNVMAANATSAALMLSDIPWGGTYSKDELFNCDLDLVYACTGDHKTLMADVHAREDTKKDLEEALQLAPRQAIKYLAPQIILAEKAGKHNKDYTLTMLKESTVQKKAFHRWISEKDLRVDGRRLDEVRQLKCESTKMSELQGSSLFAGGPTQVICTVAQRRPGDDEAKNLGNDLLRLDGNWKIGDCDSYDHLFSTPWSIALMVSGVPLKKPVAGVSVGIVNLSSLEEHLVDMNFKVAGSRDGIRLDVNGPASKGRLEILDRMEKEIGALDYCTSDDWGWSDATVVTYRLPVKAIELLTEPDGAWQRDFERETGARSSMIEDDRDISVAAKNKTSHMLAKQKLETVTGNEVQVIGLHEDGVTQMKSYVEIPIEQVDQLPDNVYAVERQELTDSGGEDQLHRSLHFDWQTMFTLMHP